MELTRACQKQYALEQELAFYKIDAKFEPLNYYPSEVSLHFFSNLKLKPGLGDVGGRQVIGTLTGFLPLVAPFFLNIFVFVFVCIGEGIYLEVRQFWGVTSLLPLCGSQRQAWQQVPLPQVPLPAEPALQSHSILLIKGYHQSKLYFG